MEIIQERAPRAVFQSKSETYSELLTGAGLYQQRLQNTGILMYEVKNGLVPTYITEIFNTTPKQYNLRNADLIFHVFAPYIMESIRYRNDILGPIFGTN